MKVILIILYCLACCLMCGNIARLKSGKQRKYNEDLAAVIGLVLGVLAVFYYAGVPDLNLWERVA